MKTNLQLENTNYKYWPKANLLTQMDIWIDVFADAKQFTQTTAYDVLGIQKMSVSIEGQKPNWKAYTKNELVNFITTIINYKK